MSLRHPRKLSLAAAVFGVITCLTALLPPAARADIQGPLRRKSADPDPGNSAKERIKRAIAIPTPRDAAVKVFRGHPTEIVLEATNASRQAVEFRLGNLPKHGTLTGPEPSADSKDKAVVVYTAWTENTAQQDQFTFRVKCRDTPASGSALVNIDITDRKPVLKVDSQLDFGEVPIGETAVRSLEFKNVGTGPLTHSLTVPPPWRVLDERGVLMLEPGGRETVRISYMPASPAEHRHNLVFEGVEGGQVTLRAKGVAPFEVRPSWVQIEWIAESKSRRGTFAVVNRSPSQLSFAIESSPRLKTNPASGDLAPEAMQEVEVMIPTEDGREFHEPLSVVARSCRVEVPISADATPAWLRLDDVKGEKAGDGAILVPSNGEAVTLLVKNAGGTTAPLFINLPSGFEFGGFDAGRDVKPGETVTFAVRAAATRGSLPEGLASLELGDAKLPVLFRGQKIKSSTTTPTAASHALLNAPATRSDTAPAADSARTTGEGDGMTNQEAHLRMMLNTLGVFPSTVEFDRTLPEIDAVAVKAMSPTSLTLVWRAVAPEYDYVVFRQEYRPLPGDSLPTRRWLPWEGLNFKKSSSEVQVTLNKLKPGRRYSLRLAVKAPDGKLGQASPPFVAITPSGRSGLWWKIALGVVVVAIASWFGWRLWQRRYEE